MKYVSKFVELKRSSFVGMLNGRGGLLDMMNWLWRLQMHSTLQVYVFTQKA